MRGDVMTARACAAPVVLLHSWSSTAGKRAIRRHHATLDALRAASQRFDEHLDDVRVLSRALGGILGNEEAWRLERHAAALQATQGYIGRLMRAFEDEMSHARAATPRKRRNRRARS